METTPFVIERTYNAPAAKVWKAITDKNEMKQWYFDLAEFKPEVGFEFRFYSGKDPNAPYLHICRITEVEVGKKLTHSWRYDGYPGDSFVSFELFDEGNKTRLRLSHNKIETLGDNPDFAKHNFAAGWTQIIGTNLEEYLEKTA